MSEPQPNINQMKDVEFYAANLNAWINTRFEHDKSLLALSAGAIGLLITLISTVGVKTIETLVLYIFALICFVVCLGAILWIFKRNAKHLEDVLRDAATDDPLLNALDSISVASFMLGVIFSSIIGTSTAIYSYIEKDSEVTDKTKIKNRTIAQDSISGISDMRPFSESDKISINGISNMKPAAPQPIVKPTKSSDEKK